MGLPEGLKQPNLSKRDSLDRYPMRLTCLQNSQIDAKWSTYNDYRTYIFSKIKYLNLVLSAATEVVLR
jgi:hypothetical protein